MYHIGLDLIEEILHLTEAARNVEPLLQLPGHQFFAVADSDDAAAGDVLNLLCVLIGNLAASNDSNLQHRLARLPDVLEVPPRSL